MDRPLSKASLYSFGDDDRLSPASMDASIGHAGRMQNETKAAAIAKVTGASGISGLLSLLPINTVTNLINGVVAVRNGGTTQADGRPELDVDGQFYSVLLWKGLQKQKNPNDYFNSAINNLRTGNISGAVNSVEQGINNVANIISNPVAFATGQVSLTGEPSKEERNRTWDTSFDGRRYFITGKNAADRYLKNSMLEDGSSFLAATNRQPFTISGVTDRLPLASEIRSIQLSVENTISSAKNVATDSLRKLTSSIPATPNLGLGTLPDIPVASDFAQAITQGASDNPIADALMTFDQLSMKARYADDSHISEIHSQLQAQQDKQFAYWKDQLGSIKPSIGAGGLKPGTEVSFNPTGRNKHTTGYKDLKNTFAVAKASTSAKALKTADAYSDYINVLFYDVVNKKVIPLRAFISGISQQTSAETTDTTYIGRTDRNIVYVKATRELSFQLRLQAFSPAELGIVWEKAEYLNSLCFPAMYDKGYMVPPFVKLTIGNLYREQPGYIRSISHTIEDGTSWETVDGSQLPHGVLINVQFSLIEKTQQTGKNHKFFAFGSTITGE